MSLTRFVSTWKMDYNWQIPKCENVDIALVQACKQHVFNRMCSAVFIIAAGTRR